MESHKKRRTTSCGKPVCVAHVQCLKEAKTEAPKGLRERNIFLDSVRKLIFGAKKRGFPQFHRRLASL